MSQCRSFDSNCHPCSQSRKISIGILVDSSANIRHRSRKQDDTKVPTVEKVPSKVNSVDDGNDGEGIKAVVKGKQIEIPEHESSPWVSTRLFLQKPTTSKAVRYDLKANDGMSNRSSEVKAAPRTHSVQFSANHMAVLQSGDGKQKKIERVSYKREGSKDGTKARVEEFSFATAQENFVPEKEMVEERTNRTEDRREALRMKLWDILGTVSSPNKQVSQNPEVGMNNLNLEQIIDRQSKPIVKSRQNSDTIKPDSESPDQSIRRPVTRSLTRKRVPGKVQTKKTKNAPSSTYTSKHPEKNIFSFEEGFSGRLDAAVTGASPKAFRKKRERKGFKAEAHGTCFPEKDNPDFIQQATDLSKRTKCAQKTSLGGNIKGTFHIYPPKNNSEFAKLENRTRKKDSVQLSAMKITDEQSNLHTYTAPKLKDQQEVLANSFRKNIVDPRFDLQSPTFELGTPNKSCSPGSLPKTNHGEVDDQSPAHCIFTSLLPSRPDHHKANIGTVSSDNAEELEDSPLTKSEPDMEENDAENGLSKSSSEERDSKSSKEGSPIREGYKDTEVFTHGRETESPTPEIGTAGKIKFACYPSKKLQSQEDHQFDEFNPISTSPKGPEETNGLHGLSGQNQEDGLTNAITLIASALERLKSKIKSAASKKSAEVLMSIAEGMCLQLQNAESHIQRDVGKLTSLGKSKRRRLETEFEEQQEQLKLIYRKFEAELNRHLQECRSTVEGLEAQEIEYRGFLKKQKTSHRKLLKQVEEAIETQLNDAQGRITAVHKALETSRIVRTLCAGDVSGKLCFASSPTALMF